jgi:hypothetical protein
MSKILGFAGQINSFCEIFGPLVACCPCLTESEDKFNEKGQFSIAYNVSEITDKTTAFNEVIYQCLCLRLFLSLFTVYIVTFFQHKNKDLFFLVNFINKILPKEHFQGFKSLTIFTPFYPQSICGKKV